MDRITVYHQSGGSFDLYSGGGVASFEKVEQRYSLMDEDVIEMSITASSTITFDIGDYIVVYGRIYFLNSIPVLRREGLHKFSYEVKFEGIMYQLSKAVFLNVTYSASTEEAPPNYFTGGFSLTGDLSLFLEVLTYNLARLTEHDSLVWNIGTSVPATETLTLDFSGETCLAALQRLADEFKVEFTFSYGDGAVSINFYSIGGAGTNLNLSLRYGQNKGLYSIERQNIDDSNVVTALFALGSDKNLAANYRGYSPRLKLPGNELSLLINAPKVSLYGYVEGYKQFDTIYPHRTGTVTGISTADPVDVLEFFDSTMSFDLNAASGGNTLYLISGVPAKIHFNTGLLAGYEFELHSYTHSTKKFKIVSYKDERGQNFPDPDSEAFRISVGDKYVILDIRLPQAYIDSAEAALLAEATAELNKISQPRVRYNVVFDTLFVKRTFQDYIDSNYFHPGDIIHITDSELGVNKNLRVISFTRNLLSKYEYTIDLGDEVVRPKGWINKNTVSQIGAAVNKFYSSTWRQRVVNTVINQEFTVINGGSNVKKGFNIPVTAVGFHIEFEGDVFPDNTYWLDIKLVKSDGTITYHISETKEPDGFWITMEDLEESVFLSYIAIR